MTMVGMSAMRNKLESDSLSESKIHVHFASSASSLRIASASSLIVGYWPTRTEITAMF